MRRFSMCWVAVAALAGCAGHPAMPGGTSSQPVAGAPVATGRAAATAADTNGAHQVPVDSSNVADVQAAGYKIVNKDGEKLYCRKDPITGSRVQFQTTCLTARELYDKQHQTQEAMSLISNQLTPVNQCMPNVPCK
jgi:hypothetical protein